jgi:hypothetical protein
MLLVFFPVCGWASEDVEGKTLTEKGVFHEVGLPKVRRGQRVDLTFTSDSLVVDRKNKTVATVPYKNMRRVQLLSGVRHYPGATYAAAVATFGAGGFLILKKRKVDTIVLEYVNERGGAMGAVFQMAIPGGARTKRWLERFGVPVEEPAPPIPPASKQSSEKK